MRRGAAVTVLTTAHEAGLPGGRSLPACACAGPGRWRASTRRGGAGAAARRDSPRPSCRRRGAGTATGRGRAPGRVRRSETAAPVVRLRPPARAGPSVAHRGASVGLSAYVAVRARGATACCRWTTPGLADRRPVRRPRRGGHSARRPRAVHPPLRRPESRLGVRTGPWSDRRVDRFREGLAALVQAMRLLRERIGCGPDRGRRRCGRCRRWSAGRPRARWRTIRGRAHRLPAGRRISRRSIRCRCPGTAEHRSARGLRHGAGGGDARGCPVVASDLPRATCRGADRMGSLSARRPRPACGGLAESTTRRSASASLTRRWRGFSTRGCVAASPPGCRGRGPLMAIAAAAGLHTRAEPRPTGGHAARVVGRRAMTIRLPPSRGQERAPEPDLRRRRRPEDGQLQHPRHPPT